jgi:hypothetical protein
MKSENRRAKQVLPQEGTRRGECGHWWEREGGRDRERKKDEYSTNVYTCI